MTIIDATALPRGRRFRRGAVLALAGALAAAFAAVLPLLPTAPAHAASTVEVTPQPSTEGPTTVTLNGSGFQYLPNAPGGIYVMFGVVSDPVSWAPSAGGASGVTYSYASTDGAILLVGFEGGAEGGDAAIAADGSWSAELTIPGPTFELSAGRTAETAAGSVDCRQQTCGIITIGAMGSVNANNESFTPVTFAEPAPVQAAPDEAPDAAATADGDSDAEQPVAIAADADTDADAAAADDSETPGALPWLIGGGALVVIALIAWALIARSRAAARRAAATGAATSTTATASTATETSTTDPTTNAEEQQ